MIRWKLQSDNEIKETGALAGGGVLWGFNTLSSSYSSLVFQRGRSCTRIALPSVWEIETFFRKKKVSDFKTPR